MSDELDLLTRKARNKHEELQLAKKELYREQSLQEINDGYVSGEELDSYTLKVRQAEDDLIDALEAVGQAEGGKEALAKLRAELGI